MILPKRFIFLSVMLCGSLELSANAPQLAEDADSAIVATYEKAKLGDTAAQMEMAVWYWDLHWENENATEKAFYWFSKAAENNYPEANYQMGFFYQHGIGCEINQKEALRWYEKAMELGDVMASSQLAYYYYWGVEVTIDKSKALDFCEKALQNGDSMIRNNVAWFLATLPDDEYVNGPRALSLMQTVIADRPADAGFYDTLAAAYAACGELEMAITYQKVALELCTLQLPEQENAFRERLALYEQGKRYRQIEPFK